MNMFSPLALTQALPFMPLAQGDIDYEVERRNEPHLVEKLLLTPGTRVILVRNGQLAIPRGLANPMTRGGKPIRLATLPGEYVGAELTTHPEVVGMFLGTYHGTHASDHTKNQAVVAIDITAVREIVPEPISLSNECADAAFAEQREADDAAAAIDTGQFGVVPRSVIAMHGKREPVLEQAITRFDWIDLRDFMPHASARDIGIAVSALSLGAWHDMQRFCPACGARVVSTLAGWAQQCSNPFDNNRVLFPRIEPAVITAVVDAQDRLLLQHNHAWKNEHVYSVSAGFVEAGENLEHAARRETKEETGIDIGELKYLGSQPWPFKSSLMVGFKAQALSTEIHVDGTETEDAVWMTRDEYTDALVTGRMEAPGKATIARVMIEEWYGREIS